MSPAPLSKPPHFYRTWSIGIFAGPSPLALAPRCLAANPVIRAADVTDADAEFVADPFMLRSGDSWHLFFEVLDRSTGRGAIGLAESPDGTRWSYRRIVLKEPFHLSYPHVFEAGGEIYMLPETLAPKAVRLYRATEFPLRWKAVADLVPGSFADPTVFFREGRWWMFVCPQPSSNDELMLYLADELTGPWRPHPRNPLIVSDPYRARPAGRVTPWNGRLIRYAQTCWPVYGGCVRAMEISRLTPTEYAEVECEGSPILSGSGAGWNASGMHHVDPHRLPDGSWVAIVDGFYADPPVTVSPDPA